MISVDFYDSNLIEEDKIEFVVIVAFYDNKLIVVRHKDRETWEIPGGHKEEHESSEEAAKRELFEETGAKFYDLKWICTYAVNRNSYGQLYFADVKELETLPESEIGEVKIVNDLPEKLTYPLIQPYLYHRVLNYIVSTRG